MYKIIGGNQTEYGPVSVEQLRQWITEGRINADTPAQAVGDTGWKPISSYPDFAASFPSKTIPPLPSGTPPSLANVVPETGTRARAQEEVNGPAIGLLVVAGLGIASALFGLITNTLGMTFGSFNAFNQMNGQNMPGADPRIVHMMQSFQSYGALFGIILSCVKLVTAAFLIFAALKMKKLESHGLCVFASVLAIIPCLSPCCLPGIAIGIWAIITLNKPEVRSHFS